MRIVAAVLAAGKGERFGGDKVSALLAGKPIWRHSYETLKEHPAIGGVGVVISVESYEKVKTEARDALFVIIGGSTRQESSRLAVEAAADCDILLIHDAARPFLSVDLIDRVLEGVRRSGAAAPGVPPSDTLRFQDRGTWHLVDRSHTLAMQTPQAAPRELLLRAHHETTGNYTDEMELLASAGIPFELVEGDSRNFKITTSDDLGRARGLVGGAETRTGIGYDIHRFASDSRPLMLGGVRFDGPGLEGHSDADVVVHAAVDALLGAASLGDIGQHFPNCDPKWKNTPSLHFLRYAGELIRTEGWRIIHLDVTMIGEYPRVMPQCLEIRQSLADSLGVEIGRVSFKATTNEGLGSIGRGEGIAAYAVSTIAEH